MTALEFCYTTKTNPNENSARDVFDFLLLNRRTGNEFKVVKSTLVRATPQANCMNSYNPRRCCEVFEFNSQGQFVITSPNLAIGFGSRRDGQLNHQGLQDNSYTMYTTSSHITTMSLNSGSIADLDAPVDQSLRLAWLHIGELTMKSLLIME